MFDIEQHTYMACADRFTGWLMVFHFKPGTPTSSKLISVCHTILQAYGALEEISTDEGSIFMSKEFQEFLRSWCVQHRLSSVAYAQLNGRAEVAVQTAKRILRCNISSNGSVDSDKVARAVLQYRNTPIQGVGLSPAQMLLHSDLRDFLPTHPNFCIPHAD